MKRPPSKTRSAVSNGTRLYLTALDGRSEAARRFADILRDIEAEHGGREHMGVATHAAARAFAQLCVEREIMEQRRAEGHEIDVELYGQLCDRIDRQARRIVPPERKSKPDLREYLKGRRNA